MRNGEFPGHFEEPGNRKIDRNIIINVAVDFYICFESFEKFKYVIPKFSFDYCFLECDICLK